MNVVLECIQRGHGRSVIGLPARRVTDSQRTPHITMLCAIIPTLGLIAFQNHDWWSEAKRLR